MSFPDYPLNCSVNYSQIGSGALSSVSVKRKAEESKIENQEEKTTGLAEQRFSGNCVEEPPSKRRKVVEGGQKGKEKIDEDEETPEQEECQMMVDWQEALPLEEANNPEFSSKEEINNSILIPFIFCPSDALSEASNGSEIVSFVSDSDVSQEKGIATTEELWQFLDECLPKMMPESYFYFEEKGFEGKGTLVHKDIIKELLKYRFRLKVPLDRFYARQTILCKNGQQIIISGFEKILLEQKSPVLKLLFEDNSFQEANSQNSISWEIDQKICRILLRNLYQPNILLDGQKELNEEEKEKTFIALLDQANQWEIKELKSDLISWFQKRLSLLDKRKDKDLEKIVVWHGFARSREFTSLQKGCEDFLIKSFLLAEDDQEQQRLIETLKKIQMTQLDVSQFSDSNISQTNLPEELLGYSGYSDLKIPYLKKVAYLIKELSLTELNLGTCPWLIDNSLALLKDLPLKKLTIVSRIMDHGLVHLKNMPLEELSLGCANLTDKSFIYLQDFKNLRVLDLSRSLSRSKITGTGLIHLKDLPLETLILNCCSHECMNHLKHFTKLQRLYLGYSGIAVGKNFLAPLADLSYLRILHLCPLKDVDGLIHLKKLPLEELRLFYANVIGSHDLEDLEGLPLKKLALINCQGIEDTALTSLKKLPSLEELEIYDNHDNSKLTNAGIAHLGDLFSLKKLKLLVGKNPNVTGDCLIHLQNLSRLEELECDVQTIKGGDLGNLERLPLRKLFLMGRQGIEDDALTSLKKLPLEEVRIWEKHSSNSKLTNAGVAHLGDLCSLKKLQLLGKNLTGVCLIHLRNLSRLEELECDVQTIKGGDLGNLERLPLRKLSLTTSSGGIEDDALTSLKKLPLEELAIYEQHFSNNKLTNAGVAHLGDLYSLKKLTLRGIGKHLTGACVVNLQNLSRLEELFCWFPVLITGEDLAYLKKKLPLLKISNPRSLSF